MQRGKERIRLLQATCQMPQHRLWGSEQEQSQQQLVWTPCPIQRFFLNPHVSLGAGGFGHLVPA